MANIDGVAGKYKRRLTAHDKSMALSEPEVTNSVESPFYYNLPLSEEPEAKNGGHDPEKNVPPYLAPKKSSLEDSQVLSPKQGATRRDKGLYYRQMDYEIDQVPPWPVCIFLGFQHYLIMFGATVANPMVLMDPLCVEADDTATRSQLIGTIFVVAGISTLLQCTIGVRLPIVQGGTFIFVSPIVTLLKLPLWNCEAARAAQASLLNATSSPVSMTTTENMTGEPLWMPRIREVQGAIILASLFQMVIGFSGVIGLMLRFIGPLSIAPTITLAGLALFDIAASKSQGQWWITLVTVVLIAAFSQYTKNVNIPCIGFEKGKGLKTQPFPIFRLFPVILAIGITWIICAILTAVNVFGKSNKGGTSNQLEVLEQAAWFRVPYPGQWGMPTVSTASVFGLLAAVLTSIVESVGDYYACARMSRVPPPPINSINRGIGVEGLATLVAGAFGSGTGTTSYSENIGAIGITKVGSRRVVQCAGVIMILFGVFNKFGSVFATIPEPIIGGLFIVMFGMIVAVGLSNLQFVDLNSSRNLFIIGFSFFFGITLPGYLSKNEDAIKTGSDAVDQVLRILLQTSMFVGGLSGFILDNTIPGTDEERGIQKWNTHAPTSKGDVAAEISRCYDIPAVTTFLQKFTWTRYIPFLPTYDQDLIFSFCGKFRKRKDKASKERQPKDPKVPKGKTQISDV